MEDNDNLLRSEGDLNTSRARDIFIAKHADDETKYWLDEDSRYFLHQSLSSPCLDVLQSCDGAHIKNLKGKKILDFHGNNVHQVGFSNEKVIQAIVDQMKELSFCTRRYTNIPSIKLAKKLAELAPGDINKVLFAPGGTSAIGMAIKLARVATGRYKTISMWDSFHGASLDAISIGGEAIFRNNIGPLMPGTEHVPPPNPQHCPFGCESSCNLKCADYIEYVLDKEGDVAAVIAETLRSTPYIPPKDYWKKVRKACDKHGTLLILDEIPHALGRTGKMFTVEHYDIVPDMLVIGKGLGGGIFPLAALLVREGLDLMKDRALGHYTHEKNPVACAAALEAIQFIEENKLLEKVDKLGNYTLSTLKQMKERLPSMGDVRGIGLMLGVEVVNPHTKLRDNDRAEKIMYLALEKGLNFKLTMGNIISLTPALTITKDEMDLALEILEQSFISLE